jgi:hypothetical protein
MKLKRKINRVTTSLHLWPIRAASVPRIPSVRPADVVGTPKFSAVIKIRPSAPPAYSAYSPGSNTTAFNAVGKTIDLRRVPRARLQICKHATPNKSNSCAEKRSSFAPTDFQNEHNTAVKYHLIVLQHINICRTFQLH